MPESLEALRAPVKRLLEDAQTRLARAAGRQRQEREVSAVDTAMKRLEDLMKAYGEDLVAQVHSVQVKKIAQDFKRLVAFLRRVPATPLAEDQQEAVRLRIKAWHYESRRWVADLPLQRCVRGLASRDGKSPAEREDEVKRLWLEVRGAWFSPDLVPDPMDPLGKDPEATLLWECRPGPLMDLLGLAEEALEAEIGGPNLGGHASFAQRRRRDSLKDAFAFSCLLIYDEAVGPRAGRQRPFPDSDPSNFEKFVAAVHTWAVGPKARSTWVIGLDPIRRAIRTQKAWLRLFKAARCTGAEAFNALTEEEQKAARRKLPEKVLRRLKPAAAPLIKIF